MKNKNAQIGSTLSMFVMIIVVIMILVTFALISGIVKSSVFSKDEGQEKDRLGMDAYDILYEDSISYLFENENNEVVCDDFFVIVADAVNGDAYFKIDGDNLILCLGNDNCKVLGKNIISASELQIFLMKSQTVIKINGVEKEIIIVLDDDNNNEDSIEFMFTLCAISEKCVLDYGNWISQQRVSIKNGDYFKKNEKLKEFLEKGEEYTSDSKHKIELLWEVMGGKKYNC